MVILRSLMRGHGECNLVGVITQLFEVNVLVLNVLYMGVCICNHAPKVNCRPINVSLWAAESVTWLVAPDII
jgi:hypothetical protein